MKCELNPYKPCPLNRDGQCASWREIEMVLAPYGWLKCATREKEELKRERKSK